MSNEGKGSTGSSPSALSQAVTAASIATAVISGVAAAHHGNVGQIATKAGEGYARVQTVEAQRGSSGKGD